MIPKSAHHVSFSVRDLDRARAFYENVLGLEPIERPDFGFPGAWLQAADVQVHLIQVPADFPGEARSGRPNPMENHTAFAIDDYEKVVGELRSRGADVLETSAEVGQMWVRDPDGNVIELIAPGGRLGRR